MVNDSEKRDRPDFEISSRDDHWSKIEPKRPRIERDMGLRRYRRTTQLGVVSHTDDDDRARVARRGQDARVAARAHCAALAGKRGWSELDDLVSCEVTVYAAVENARLAFLYHLDMAPSPHRDRALAAWAADRWPGTDRCFAES